jgi:hypothetical protein
MPDIPDIKVRRVTATPSMANACSSTPDMPYLDKFDHCHRAAGATGDLPVKLRRQ